MKHQCLLTKGNQTTIQWVNADKAVHGKTIAIGLPRRITDKVYRVDESDGWIVKEVYTKFSRAFANAMEAIQ